MTTARPRRPDDGLGGREMFSLCWVWSWVKPGKARSHHGEGLLKREVNACSSLLLLGFCGGDSFLLVFCLSQFDSSFLSLATESIITNSNTDGWSTREETASSPIWLWSGLLTSKTKAVERWCTHLGSGQSTPTLLCLHLPFHGILLQSPVQTSRKPALLSPALGDTSCFEFLQHLPVCATHCSYTSLIFWGHSPCICAVSRHPKLLRVGKHVTKSQALC